MTQVERNGAPGPCFRQREAQLVHTGSVLCTEVQAVRLGQKFSAAALPLNDLDVHLKTFLSVFCLIVQPLPGSCQCGLLLHKFLCFGILPGGAFHE